MDRYTIPELAEDLEESEDRVERLMHELEEEGVVKCIDGEHWDIKSWTKAITFLAKNVRHL